MALRVERYYSLAEVKAEVFPSRSARWIRDQARAGAFGDVCRDAKGWLIPASGLAGYLARHLVQAGDQVETRSSQVSNLVQHRGRAFSS